MVVQEYDDVDEDLTPAERLAKQRAQLKKRLGEPLHSSCWMLQGLHDIMTATGCRFVPDSSKVWCTWGYNPTGDLIFTHIGNPGRVTLVPCAAVCAPRLGPRRPGEGV